MVIDSAIEENQSIKNIKGEVSVLKADDVAFKIEATKHCQKLDRLDDKIHHQGLVLESMQRDLKLILNAVIPSKERIAQIEKIETLVEQHDRRIHALEMTLRDHLRDHHKS